LVRVQRRRARAKTSCRVLRYTVQKEILQSGLKRYRQCIIASEVKPIEKLDNVIQHSLFHSLKKLVIKCDQAPAY
jgi:hypothetical protein